MFFKHFRDPMKVDLKKNRKKMKERESCFSCHWYSADARLFAQSHLWFPVTLLSLVTSIVTDQDKIRWLALSSSCTEHQE